MTHNIRDKIKSITEIKQNEQTNDDIMWTSVSKPKKKPTTPRAKNEIPIYLELNGESHSISSSNLRRKNNGSKKLIGHEKNFNTEREKNSNNFFNDNNFCHIVPSVREATGGRNTQSNEAIEKRQRERQQKYIDENQDLSSSDSYSATYVTVSSETTDSYKTAIQDSYELMIGNQLETSEKLDDCYIERYKKNALIAGLLRNTETKSWNDTEISTDCSIDFLDASGSVKDIENEVANLTIEEEEQVMRNERLGRLFQSQEDEDVYYHPLKEEIKNIDEWKNARLKRKGVETTQSARQYYMSIDNDGFVFQSNK